MSEKPNPAIARIIAAIAEEEGPLPPKKLLVVQAAIQCFAEVGFAATSTRMIASRAGVAEATIFKHFETKKGLLLRIVGPVVKRLLAPAAEKEAVDLAKTAGNNLRKFKCDMMLSRLRFADAYGPYVQIMLQELPVNPDLRGLVQAHVFSVEGGGLYGVMTELLEGYQRQGKMQAIAPPQLIRWAISLLVGYYVNSRMIAPGDWDDEAEVAAMVDMMLGGIEA